MTVLRLLAALEIVLALSGCAGATQSNVPPQRPLEAAAIVPDGSVYEPLAAGDSWTYVCNNQFSIVNRVLGTVEYGGRKLYEFSVQIPSSPQRSTHEIQLLSNDSSGNTWIRGYLSGGKVRPIKPAEIVSSHPKLHAHYDYTGPKGKTVSRIFMGFEYTNKTPLGTFWVAPYFESNATHNYGYALGKGIMEEDHGPSYRYDCLIDKIGHAMRRP